MADTLSPTMQRGLALAREQGELHRRPGGYWTVPGEPMRMGKWGPVAGRQRYVGTRTVRALVRRGLVERDGDYAVTVTDTKGGS